MRIPLLFFLSLFCVSCGLKYNGIDISHHNAVDWEAVKRDSNVQFCYVKCSEGSTHVDNRYKAHLKNAKDAGLKVGLYHYLSTKSSGKAQFEHFDRQLKAHQWDLIPVVDVEDDGNDFSDVSRVRAILKEFIDSFYKEYGFLPIVYYGDFNGYKTMPAAWKCKSWHRTLDYSHVFPFKFRQVAVESKYGGPIDLNYCKNLDYILVK